jgi:hypothetical protein
MDQPPSCLGQCLSSIPTTAYPTTFAYSQTFVARTNHLLRRHAAKYRPLLPRVSTAFCHEDGDDDAMTLATMQWALAQRLYGDPSFRHSAKNLNLLQMIYGDTKPLHMLPRAEIRPLFVSLESDGEHDTVRRFLTRFTLGKSSTYVALSEFNNSLQLRTYT